MSTAPIITDESALLASLRAGSDGAFEQLVRTHAARMLAVARRYLRDESDASDAVQDAFIQAFRHIDDFAGNSRLGSWLHRITVNAALMKLRSKRRAGEQSIDEFLPQFIADGHRTGTKPAWSESSDQMLLRAETRRIVLEAINALPDDYRTIILLRDIDEMDTRSTADLLGISEALVKTRLHRARQALRTLLERHFVPDER